MKTPAQIVEQVFGETESSKYLVAAYIDADTVRSYITNAVQIAQSEMLPGLEAMRAAREEMGKVETAFSEEEDDVTADDVERQREKYDSAVERFLEGLGI